MNPVLVLSTTLVAVAFVAWIVSAQSRQARLYYEGPSAGRTGGLTANTTSGKSLASWPPPAVRPDGD
jgi:hypothetical protein